MDDKYHNLDDIEQLSQYIHTISKNIENIDNQLNNSKQFSKQQCDTINEKENDDDESPINKKQYVIQTSTNESDSEVPNPFVRRYKTKKKLSLQPPTFESAPNKTYFSNSMSMTNCHAFQSNTQRKESPSIHEEIENIYQDNNNNNISDVEDKQIQNVKAFNMKDINVNTNTNTNNGSKANLVKKKKPIKLLLSSSLRKNQQTNKVFNITHLNNSTISNAAGNTHMNVNMNRNNSKKKNNLNLSTCDNSMINSLRSNVLQKKKSSRNIQNAGDVGNNNSMIVSLRMTSALKKRKQLLNPLENSFNNNWDIKNNTKSENKVSAIYQKTTPTFNKVKNINSSNTKTKNTTIINKNKPQISSLAINNKQLKQSPAFKRVSARIKPNVLNQENSINDKLDSARKPKKQFSQKNISYKKIIPNQFNDMLRFMKIINDTLNTKRNVVNKEDIELKKKEEYKVELIQQKWREYYIRKYILNTNNNKQQEVNSFCVGYLINELSEKDSNFNEFIVQVNKLYEVYEKCCKGKQFCESKRNIIGKDGLRMSNVINKHLNSNNKKKITKKK